MSGNPDEDHKRGGHVYLEHTEAARICKVLKVNGVIPDFRALNGIRFAPAALFNSYRDVWIMIEEQYKQYENKRGVIA